jgi:hypothetical protein
MPIVDGYWIPNLFPKQIEVFNDRSRALLVDGPRKSGKTLGVLHRITRHMFETKGARTAMFSKTMKKSKDGGTWQDLHKIILPEWIGGNIGLKYTTNDSNGKPGWKVDGQTRTPFFRIRNAHGGESECLLFSLDFDKDIESKIKEQRFSCIYFSELSDFRDRKVLSVALPQLRMPHLSMEEQFWIADTNPSEEGENSWIYNVWYKEKNWTYEEYKASREKAGLPSMKEQTFLNFQKGLGRITIIPEENTFLDPRELEELKATYEYDPGLYSRYIEGKWVFGDGDGSYHFRAFFKRNLHVVGSAEAADPEEWLVANPSPKSFELVTGWDMGDTNHAAGFIDKELINGKLHFTVIDECCSIGKETSIEDFTLGMCDILDSIERTAGRKFDLSRAWSDRSSIEKYNATADTFPYLIVYAISESRFFLEGVPKGPGSVRVRVQLIKRLLHTRRLLVSAHCVNVIAMLENLRRGLDALDFVAQDKHKHSFDWLSYALLMECAEELIQNPSRAGSPRVREALDLGV